MYFFLFLSILYGVYTRDCSCVAACLVRYLRQCSAANPADIYVPSACGLWRSFTFAHCHDSTEKRLAGGTYPE